ncbi:MAG: endolytic transglycosylase MltG [Oscillospiraceae bacterium]|nr:endolytic transglycosylase MltG [Oscillospiraceae bacterium]
MKRKIWWVPALLLVLLSACAPTVPAQETGAGPFETAEVPLSWNQWPDTSPSAPSQEEPPAAQTPLSGNPSAKTSARQPGAAPSITAKTVSADSQPPSTERAVVRIVVPEGSTFYQIARQLDSKGICSEKAFYDAAQAYRVQSFTVPVRSDRCYHLEGYLFPDTYEFYQGSDPVEVLRRMLNNYAAKSGLPADETLVLASIVEREARSAEHMAMVASVFRNRLAKGMKLQADSTITYVEQSIKPNALVPDPGRFAALYNTYKCAALPAGPICCPGVRAINAARNPAKSDYLYFFFGNDNQNHYSVTLEEHEARMKQYGVQYD